MNVDNSELKMVYASVQSDQDDYINKSFNQAQALIPMGAKVVNTQQLFLKYEGGLYMSISYIWYTFSKVQPLQVKIVG